MKKSVWFLIVALGGCAADPPNTTIMPPFAPPEPIALTPPEPLAEPPLPVPLPPAPELSTLPPPLFEAIPNAGDAPPDAALPPGSDDPFDTTMKRLREGTQAPAAAVPGVPDPQPLNPAPAATSTAPAAITAVPAAPSPNSAAGQRTPLMRPGYRDHYGGLNSDGDTPAH